MRSEPLRSEPISNATKPAATAAAAPPDDPPGARVTSQGLFVTPYTGLKLCQSASCCATLVLPNTTAPANFRRDTAMLSACTGMPSVPGMPQVVGSPSMLKHSFTVIGSPSSAPCSPRARALSAANAASRARAKSRTATAFSLASRDSTRAIAMSNNSTADTSRAASAASWAWAVANCMLISFAWHQHQRQTCHVHDRLCAPCIHWHLHSVDTPQAKTCLFFPPPAVTWLCWLRMLCAIAIRCSTNS